MVATSTSAIERLQLMTVASVMRRCVVVVPWCATMDLAAAMLADAHVDGAPVVDDAGRCIGVLSATDLSGYGMSCRQPDECKCDMDGAPEQLDLTWDSVRRFMTPTAPSIGPQESLAMASQLMCEKQIHQLLVLDERNSPLGIVSLLDIVAVLISAAEGAAQSTGLVAGQSREASDEHVC